MVDYVAVLRRTIDALPKNTPDIRERVYTKARQTVQSKLAMINPAPSQALIAKQMSGLEAAIGTVEADFAVAVEALPEPTAPEADPLDQILAAMPSANRTAAAARGAMSNEDAFFRQTETRVAVQSQLPPQPALPVKQSDPSSFQRPAVADPLPFEVPDRPRLPETSTLDFLDQPGLARPQSRTQDEFDEVFGDLPPPRIAPELTTASLQANLDEPVVLPMFTRQPKQKVKSGRLLMPLLGLALLGGAGALAWTERDQIIALLQPEQQAAVATQVEPPVVPENTPAIEPAPAQTPPAETVAGTLQKFTQRLNPDGTEVDAGTGTSGGEQSVAQLEPAAEAPVEAAPPAVETPAVTPAVTPETATTPAEAIPVGQKAIFYEERTSGAEGSARAGAVVWSIVRESPGNDRPPEAAVRGELSIPEAGLNVRMTLRRNADATLPASHILELIMTVPDDFSGGTIEDVQRVNFKPTEESAGAPLSATPVKVADKFFLVALENSPAAVQANLALLREQSWIDLPVVYRTGRRALFTMEKGLVGDQVFKQVLDAWAAAPLQ